MPRSAWCARCPCRARLPAAVPAAFRRCRTRPAICRLHPDATCPDSSAAIRPATPAPKRCSACCSSRAIRPWARPLATFSSRQRSNCASIIVLIVAPFRSASSRSHSSSGGRPPSTPWRRSIAATRRYSPRRNTADSVLAWRRNASARSVGRRSSDATSTPASVATRSPGRGRHPNWSGEHRGTSVLGLNCCSAFTTFAAGGAGAVRRCATALWCILGLRCLVSPAAGDDHYRKSSLLNPDCRLIEPSVPLGTSSPSLSFPYTVTILRFPATTPSK